MIRGVNHRVIEVLESDCEFFERVIFFVRPEYSAMSEGTLRDRARAIAENSSAPPPSRIITTKLFRILVFFGIFLLGALLSLFFMRMIKG